MKDIFDGLGEAARDFYDMLPFNDPEKKYQRALDKLKELKKREHDVYADIGRKLYKEDGAAAYPLEVEKLHKIYDERRAAELEVEKLDAEAKRGAQQQECIQCPNCGAANTADVKFCRECGQRMAAQEEAVCAACGGKNPEGTRFCGFCGGRLGGTPPEE